MLAMLRAFRVGVFTFDIFRRIAYQDFRSGIVVGIIALPLSVGIALASGFPPFAGILSSLTGGLIVSFISGSRLSIKGPAGGLSALTFSSVLILGDGDLLTGYTFTLAAILLAGCLQVVSAYLKMGVLGDLFPASVIHGMLASLGFIMVVKQLPSLAGSTVPYHDTLEILFHLKTIVLTYNPKIAIPGIFSLLLLTGYHFFPGKIKNLIPSVILILFTGIPLGIFLELNTEHYYTFFNKHYSVDPLQALVQFPSDYISTLAAPSFNKISSPEFWFFVIALSLAGNIESLITCKAIDKIDPYHRQTNYNKDLLAIGIGNIISGFLGGLPMISESKRSIVNVNLGAGTLASNFFHAVVLLLLVIFAQPFIRLIPVSVLSSYLIYSGIKMTLPKEFSKSYSIGKEQFVVFISVFAVTIIFNILTGVLAGVIIEIIFILKTGIKPVNIFASEFKLTKNNQKDYEIKFKSPAVFSNYMYADKALQALPDGSKVKIDFTEALLVDHSFLENISHFKKLKEKKGGEITIAGLEYHSQASDHPLSSKKILITEETERQKKLSDFASACGAALDIRRITNTRHIKGFLSPDFVIDFQENRMTIHSEEKQLIISDIALHPVSYLKPTIYVTIFQLNLPAPAVPDFILQQDGFSNGLFKTSNTKDINFKDFPVFSHYYHLASANEEEIRKYFNTAVLDFFEKHKGYHMVCSGNTLLIYKRMGILDTMEIEKCINFINELCEVLKSKNISI